MEEENWAKKLGRKVHEVLKGKKAYGSSVPKKKRDTIKANEKFAELSGKLKPTAKSVKNKKSGDTKRTKDVTNRLKQAGLTDKEIERLRGKK